MTDDGGSDQDSNSGDGEKKTDSRYKEELTYTYYEDLA